MNLWKLSTFVFAGLFAGTVAVGSISMASADEQPHMHSALESLKQAEAQLQKATPDKGGHRVKAISLTRSAMAEVKKGIKFDNRN